ncbi:hypothetical protein SH528x_002968 [Novipirellula sp. SH528]|uniref:hypothetical protein n=1 Tax=Novipirellula sp. SH528 TaxID=3454466 RepID=UPI003FA101C7
MSFPSFDTIAATLGPSRLADCFSVAFDDRYSYETLTSPSEGIPREFILVHNVHTTTGFLGGGGIHGLLGLDCRERYPQQLTELGFPDLAKEIERYLISHESIPHEEVNELERRLFKLSNDIQSSVGNYIQERGSEFSELLPYVRRTLGYLEVFDSEGYDKRINEILAEQRQTRAFIDQHRAARSEERSTKFCTGGRLASLLEMVKSFVRPR